MKKKSASKSKTLLDKAYESSLVEEGIYSLWEKSGFFNPDKLPGRRGAPFTVMMPPPNVTGVLHLGHALENSIMDIEVRYQRMRGRRALLVPGTDHAAIATQARVEKDLKSEGIANPRVEFGREKLVEIIRERADQLRSTILNQIRKMGTSCDWSRLAYTFDKPRSSTVNALFTRMYKDGLIYRGYRVVNWSVKGQSTCSDDELVYVEQKTKLYTFTYSHDFPIPIATTRPETKLGDTAVAVHPSDARYKKYIGQKFTIDVGAEKPLVITVIADKGIDPKFGTGALGVTPAHSLVDFEMYQNNKDIGLIQVIGADGRITKVGGSVYQGLTVLEAREKFVESLRAKGLLIKEEELTHNVGTSDRYGDVIEVIPMDQWFIDVNKIVPGRKKTLKDLMRDAVTRGHNGDKRKKISITPDHFLKTYLHWIDNLRDWCISRQIWWGHRIPAWYRGDEIVVGEKSPKGEGWKQDEDTLDTWFSSGSWTFSTLGWPQQTKDLKKYHPTSWMQMGYEILFAWMARMILMTTYALNDIPFKDVYIHGMLRNKEGKKFSKSDRNGIDPLDIIAKYGTDALRFSVIKGITPGNDARFYEEKVEDSRNFVNKLWNIARFVMMNNEKGVRKTTLSLADRWIQARLAAVTKHISDCLEKYQFSLAAEKLYEFVWHDFADWYIEMSKTQPNPKLAVAVLKNVLVLAHPFIPFVTEEIYQRAFAKSKKDLLMITRWPTPQKISGAAKVMKEFAIVQDIVTSLRNIRATYRVEPGKQISTTLFAGKYVALLKKNAEAIKGLAKVNDLAILVRGKKIAQSSSVLVHGVMVCVPLGEVIDVIAEKTRLTKELADAESYLLVQEKKLSNQEFVSRAPTQVIAIEKEKLATQKEKIKQLKEQLANLG